MASNSSALDESTELVDDAFDGVMPSTTSDLAVQVTNAVSLAACVAVVASYLFFRSKNKRIMERTSLVLAVSMASADLLLHAINIFGYSDLPHNFICSFFGGFLYAFPTLMSLFYSFCIALNTQLVFVFGKRPGASTLKYYIGIPIFLSLCICVPALVTGLYGFDASFDMCWYSTEGKTAHEVLVPYFFTFAFWCLLAMLYLVIASISIAFAVFSTTSRLNNLATNLARSLTTLSHAAKSPPVYPNHRSLLPGDSPLPSRKSDVDVGVRTASSIHHQRTIAMVPRNETLSRRSLAMRALAFRLLGYISIPTLCILPGVIDDLITKAMPSAVENIPGELSTFFDSLNGLVGLFNAILYAMDPALLALYHQMWKEYRENRNAKNSGGLEMTTTERSDSNVEIRTEGSKPQFFLPFHAKGAKNGRGRGNSVLTNAITIKVEVQTDRDNDIDRLQNYLVGL